MIVDEVLPEIQSLVNYWFYRAMQRTWIRKIDPDNHFEIDCIWVIEKGKIEKGGVGDHYRELQLRRPKYMSISFRQNAWGLWLMNNMFPVEYVLKHKQIEEHLCNMIRVLFTGNQPYWKEIVSDNKCLHYDTKMATELVRRLENMKYSRSK